MPKCKSCGSFHLSKNLSSDGYCAACQGKAISSMNDEVKRLQNLVTPEMKDLLHVQSLKKEEEQNVATLLTKKKDLTKQIAAMEQEIKQLSKSLVVAKDDIEMESFSLYRPKFEFVNSEEYANELTIIRQKQKDMIKNKTAAVCSTTWTVNGSKTEGKKQTNDNIKLFLRSFNNECDIAISQVKFSNYDKSKLRIEKSFLTINGLGKTTCISISQAYYDLKMRELELAYQYAMKKQEEKEEQAEVRRQQREEQKVAKEIADARKAAEKEKTHYEQALLAINSQIMSCTDQAQKQALEQKKSDILNNLDNVNGKLEDIDYRQSNQRAGYVYVISNIGAFGENVYKIGMTRRLDPMERVDELGDASVPFYFDVHAMIFTPDAPALEAALHNAFDNRRLNKINRRREYFKVTLDEIKEVVKNNFDKSVEFVDVPPAEQYRESLRM